MVLEGGIPDFWKWFLGGNPLPDGGTSQGALLGWAWNMVLIFLAAFLLAWLFSIIFRGPVKGTKVFFNRFFDASRDLIFISPRRVFSLTILAFREAMRRWAWVIFIIYLLVLGFAGFFLDPQTNDPSRLYLSFVTTSAAWLLVPVVLLIAVFSIPNDVSRRTIYTVVTKPVRASEMILGRVLGFSLVSTLLLLGMGIVSYIFVNRAIDHVHAMNPANLAWAAEKTQDEDGKWLTLTGKTEYASEHRHDSNIIFKQVDGAWQANATETMFGHTHDIFADLTEQTGVDITVADGALDFRAPDHGMRVGDKFFTLSDKAITRNDEVVLDLNEAGFSVDEVVDVNSFRVTRNIPSDLPAFDGKGITIEKVSLTSSSPRGLLTARVPIYSSDFFFTDKTGEAKRAGINVGNVWEYRSYVEGGSPRASVVWIFEGVTAENFPIDNPTYARGLPLEFNISIFRTHKGDIERGVLGSLAVVNPETGRRSVATNFVAKEFTLNRHLLPRIINARSVNPNNPQADRLDLFKDFVFQGDKMMIELRCVESGQYFGIARPDMYIAADNASFGLNYIKGFFTTYLQVLVLTAFGVMFSTFLSGPLSLVCTAIVGIAGLFGDLINELLQENVIGGRLFESLYRMITRAPMTTQLDPGPVGTMVVSLDGMVYYYMRIISAILPDLPRLSGTGYVTYGFNIPADGLAIQVLTAVGFVIPLFVLSHYILKCREVAK